MNKDLSMPCHEQRPGAATARMKNVGGSCGLVCSADWVVSEQGVTIRSCSFLNES